jgi:hypothetical protein
VGCVGVGCVGWVGGWVRVGGWVGEGGWAQGGLGKGETSFTHINTRSSGVA